MKKWLKIVSCLLSLLLVMNIQCVYADDSLKITNTKNGMHVHLYKIADRSDDGYTYTDEFSDAKSTSIDLNNLKTTEDVLQAAQTLKGFAAGRSGTDLIATGDSLTYPSLTQGLYLVLIDNYTSGDTTYSYLPLLQQFPETSEVSLTKYSTTVLHKYSLVKHWSGGTNYPNSIKVDLYNGNTLEKTLTLTKKNNYAYTWTTTQDKDYSIKEHQVTGYSSSVDVSVSNGTQSFVLTNTKNPVTVTTNSSEVPTDNANNVSNTTSSGTSGTAQTGNSTKPTVTKTTSGSHTTPTLTSKRVKTGDETKINMSIMLLIMAGFVLIALGRFLKD